MLGALLFRDRIKHHGARNQPPLRPPSLYLASLAAQHAASPGFLPTASQPWSPSESLLGAPLWRGASSHHIDSSLLLLSKSRAAAAAAAGAAAGAAAAAVQRVPDNGPLLAALYALHERHRHAYYSRLHGDKETFWLACELLSDGAARRTADSPVSS